MKNTFIIFGWAAFLLAHTPSTAQIENREKSLVDGSIAPYALTLTYAKTTHLIFPSPIRYVDLGSDLVIAGKVEQAENVLRLKAAVRAFEGSTNFSVVTLDGRFYNFDVTYRESPDGFSYDLKSVERATDRNLGIEVLFEETGTTPPSSVALLMKNIHTKNQRLIRHVGSEHFGVRLALIGIYSYNGMYYFHIEIRNRTATPYHLDNLAFKIVDRKLAKRTAVQERPIAPVRQYKPSAVVQPFGSERTVIVLGNLSVTDEETLMAELFEKDGSRNKIQMRVTHSDLLRARAVKDLDLKIRR